MSRQMTNPSFKAVSGKVDYCDAGDELESNIQWGTLNLEPRTSNLERLDPGYSHPHPGNAED